MMNLLMLSAVLAADPMDVGRVVVSSPVDRVAVDLLYEQSRLAEMQAIFSNEHPELKRQSRRVQLLEATFQKLKQLGMTPDDKVLTAWRDVFLASAEAEWEVAKEVYTAEHPRLQQLQQRLATWKKLLARKNGAKEKE